MRSTNCKVDGVRHRHFCSVQDTCSEWRSIRQHSGSVEISLPDITRKTGHALITEGVYNRIYIYIVLNVGNIVSRLRGCKLILDL